ncbi:lycopene cyclase family protein [Flavobacterium gelidilacus]|uniref:lycopene cyclase family protein n=1 Tax=Flavobacterium gelidilacus TaxID=206041 RepID=UPI00040EA8DA|nr:lycopene cyclase family protein [Flavobacterium gelidilacus]
MKHYNYIFTGTGLAALLTVYEMILSNKIEDKTILLIDSDAKKTNDRTWCFWDDSNRLEEIISKKWDATLFADENFRKKLDIQPYHYKMIQGLDLYEFIFNQISKHQNIHFLQEKVIDFSDLGNHCLVKTEETSFTCNKVFNSIFNLTLVTSQKKYPLLQQHFIGWFIKSKEPVFDENTATFMDFSVNQKGNTRFMYVLPISKNEALLEYTLFSKDLLSKNEYEDEIELYIKNLGITEYEIVEKEQGNIPMTSYPFWENNSKNIINIGSSGGWTKASTGFTFKNVTKKSKQLVKFLETESDFTKFHKKDKFWFYDLLFIDVLFQDNSIGSELFSGLFKDENSGLILKFLDEETSLFEDLKVILKCPKAPFMKALFSRVF